MSEEIYKLKLEFEKSNKEFRHDIRNEVQNGLILLENTMEKQLGEIKADMKEGFNDIKVMFDKLPNSFTTKEEHTEHKLEIKYIKDKQAKTDRIYAFIAISIWGILISSFMALIIKLN